MTHKNRPPVSRGERKMTFEPAYRNSLQDGSLFEKVKIARRNFESCLLCPHECAIERKKGAGICPGIDKAMVSSYGPHFGEE